MAKSKSTPRFNEAKFVSYSLSKEMKEELKATPYSIEQAASDMLRLCDEGYKITFRRDDYNNCYACWFVAPTDREHVNNGFILTARGSSPIKALKQAVYIDAIFDHEYPTNYEERGKEDMDD